MKLTKEIFEAETNLLCPKCKCSEMIISEIGPNYVVYECAYCGHKVKLVNAKN